MDPMCDRVHQTQAVIANKHRIVFKYNLVFPCELCKN